MTTVICKYTFIRGQRKGERCDRKATYYGFCKGCSNKLSIKRELEEKKSLGVSPQDFLKVEEEENCIDFDKAHPEDITGAILDEIFEEQKKSSGKSKIYFGGEGDTNQTLYEQKSNNLKIGVISTCKRHALALLMLLRMEFDNYPSYVYYLVEDLESYDKLKNIDPKKVPRNKLLDIIEQFQDDSYMSSFDLNEEFSVTLSGYASGKYTKDVIKKRIHEVDIWTAKRFEDL